MSVHLFKNCLMSMLIFSSMTACGIQNNPSESYFETAENAYRAGQYEIAHQNYTAFLKQNPDPQLARLAERRIWSIMREFDCVQGQESGPRPVYVNQDKAQGAIPSQHPNVVNKSDRSSRLPVYE